MGTSLFVPSALAMIVWTAAAERPSSPPLPILTGPGFTGVVFPAAQARRERIDQPEARDYWTPSAADVAEMESRLRSDVGIVVQGEKRLFVNCFRGDPQQHSSWRQQLVDVDDGGLYYWRIQYRVERKRFLEVDINSDA